MIDVLARKINMLTIVESGSKVEESKTGGSVLDTNACKVRNVYNYMEKKKKKRLTELS